MLPVNAEKLSGKDQDGFTRTEIGSAQEFGLIVGLFVLALLIGLVTGALGWALFGATLIWIAVQSDQFRRVSDWANRPWRRPRNGSDSWFNLSYRPYRALMRERSRTRLATSRLRQILNLVELIPDAVLVLGPNGEIQGINNAATRVLQISDADIGIVLATILRSPDFIGFIRSGERDEEPRLLELASPMNPDHTLEARRFNTDDGGLILLIRDITRLNRLLTLRQNFVANVSHELRTPLAVIQGYMETITNPEEDSETRFALTDRLVSPLRRMQSLVDDLMLLTRLESTELETNNAPLEISGMLRSAATELGDLLHSESRIKMTVDEKLYIAANESEFHSLCVNLMSNALRYSADDQPVEVTCGKNGEKIQLSVRDYGVGIAPEHVERLTERFYRVHMADARTRGGTGLGLAIVKHVLRRLHSKLVIESELGKGSTFSCEFEPHNNREANPLANLD